MLDDLSRYTLCVAIFGSRLIAFDGQSVAFTWMEYRAEGRARQKRMTLDTDEFIRRFLLQHPPKGFHRIRHHDLFANGGRSLNLARAREPLNIEPPEDAESSRNHQNEPANRPPPPSCPACGGPMIVIDTFAPGQHPHRPRRRAPPTVEAHAA